MAQFQAMGIVSGTSQQAKDVAFVSEFWWGTYSLSTISPQKQQISAISTRSYFTVQRHLPGVSTVSLSLYCSVFQIRYTATRLVS